MYLSLLKTWCNKLLELQIKEIENPKLFGGILCPSCGRIHGRSADAIYPLLYLADKTGEEKYLTGAKNVFLWSEKNMVRPDGSYVNDTNHDWQGITVFAAIAIGESLYSYGHLLDEATRTLWTERLRIAMDFLYDFIDVVKTNVNYPITCAAAMAIAGRYLKDNRYREKSKKLAEKALHAFTEDGFIFGEGSHETVVTKKNCRPVDVGYNVEESLCALALYTSIEKDETLLSKLLSSMETHLEFMLPDGGWDNSWGTRSNKWTYWGSRTSDGCQVAYGLLADKNPAFSEAVYRNTKLMEACTHEGLLHGGPMYHSAGEPPCVHHTFTHAKALATILSHGITPKGKGKLPRDEEKAASYYPSIDTHLVSVGDWRGTLTGYDYDYVYEGHATGGALTMLYHMKLGPLSAASMTSYSFVEPNNMQLPQYYENICQTIRIEYEKDGVFYRSINDKTAVLSCREEKEKTIFSAKGILRDGNQGGEKAYTISYIFEKEKVIIEAKSEAEGAALMIPVISQNDELFGKKKEGSYFIQKPDGTLSIQSHGDLFLLEKPKPQRTDVYIGKTDRQNTRNFHPVGGFETLIFQVPMKGKAEVVLEVGEER